MDEKKVREAIELIRMEINTLEGIENCGRVIEARKKKHIALYNITIEALEKQLPKEIKAIDPERSEEFGDVEFCCPNCNSHYLCDIADVPNYCPECGIRFDS